MPAAGVPVEVTLTQIQWISVRRAVGGGFSRGTPSAARFRPVAGQITTAGEPVALNIPFENGGYFMLEARGRRRRGSQRRHAYVVLRARRGLHGLAPHDHNRIDLVPERQTYRPGETARIMIQSPWEQATALVTTEREGIRSHRQFALRSTQESIEIPITEQDIPNLYVSVLLIKGRTVAPPAAGDAAAKPEEDASDPGKPAFRLGYVELKVEDRTKRLTVAVAANREEYRPASAATVRLDVKDHAGRGAASEVTLWAVDYGVLSLTDYRTPDVLGSVYVRKALQVMNGDSRQRIISRRVLTPKGETDGGGGGLDAGAGMLRKDFRVLAFWLGLGHDGREWSRERGREAARVADDVSDHGRGGRPQLPLRIERDRSPHEQAADARADVAAVPRAGRPCVLRRGGGQPVAGPRNCVVTMRSLDRACSS
jgi:alpha-2-macroglobulin